MLPFNDKDTLLPKIQQAMVRGIPYNRALGLEVVDAEPGEAAMRLPYREDLVGNPETGVLHGGIITGLMDATCGLSVFLKLSEMRRIATLDLRIDYLKPATPPKDVVCRATC